MTTSLCVNAATLVGFSSVAESVAKRTFVPFAAWKLTVDGIMDNTTASRPGELIGEKTTVPARSSARALLRYTGKWQGADLEQCLREVYATRAETEF